MSSFDLCPLARSLELARTQFDNHCWLNWRRGYEVLGCQWSCPVIRRMKVCWDDASNRFSLWLRLQLTNFREKTEWDWHALLHWPCVSIQIYFVDDLWWTFLRESQSNHIGDFHLQHLHHRAHRSNRFPGQSHYIFRGSSGSGYLAASSPWYGYTLSLWALSCWRQNYYGQASAHPPLHFWVNHSEILTKSIPGLCEEWQTMLAAIAA